MSKYTKLSIFMLRIAIGVLFLYSGLNKLLTDFSATGFLLNATEGPLKYIYINLANSPIIDNLVIWGEVLIGACILIGAFVRIAGFFGCLMMTIFYLAVIPAERGPVNEQIIYTLVFVVLAASGAGRIYGVDMWIERLKFSENIKYYKYFLG